MTLNEKIKSKLDKFIQLNPQGSIEEFLNHVRSPQKTSAFLALGVAALTPILALATYKLTNSLSEEVATVSSIATGSLCFLLASVIKIEKEESLHQSNFDLQRKLLYKNVPWGVALKSLDENQKLTITQEITHSFENKMSNWLNNHVAIPVLSKIHTLRQKMKIEKISNSKDELTEHLFDVKNHKM